MASIYGAYSKQSRLRLDYSYKQDIENNKDIFTLNLYAEKPSGVGSHNYGYGDSKYTLTGKNGNQLINGNGNWSWSNTTQMLIASSTFEHVHNDDGSSGNIVLSASWNSGLTSSSVVGKDMSVSGTITTPDMPRASQPSINTYPNNSPAITMGKTCTIHMNSKSSAFTHTVTYKFGSASGTIASGVVNMVDWTPPLTLANQIPNSNVGSGTITVKTYKGITVIGTKTCNFNVTLPDNYGPSFTSITATRVDNGVPSSWGIYVKTKSKCTLTINEATGIYGSTIKSYSISGGGYSSTSSSFTTGVLNTAGTNTFTAKITDSRGRTATKTVSITVVDYTAPTISSYSSQRCNSAGTVTDEGTYIKALASRNYASCSSKNTATLTVAYKKSTASSYGTVTTLTSGTASTIGAGAIDINSTYDVKYTLTDAFSTVIKYDQVGTSFNTIDFKAGGKGVAFGKASEEDNLFECDFEAKFNKTLKVKDKEVITKSAINKQLSTMGWYRIIKCKNLGTYGNSFFFELGTSYNNTNNSSYIIAVNLAYKTAELSLISGIENTADTITFARVVSDSTDNCLYVEIYYNKTIMNNVYCELLHQRDDIQTVDFIPKTSTITTLCTLTLTEDTLFAGLIKSTKNGNTVTIGSQNASYCHFSNSADIPFYFYKNIYVNGNLLLASNSFAGSENVNGYKKIYGTILQWGIVDIPASIASKAVTFPIAFASACAGVYCQNFFSNQKAIGYSTSAISKTGFTTFPYNTKDLSTPTVATKCYWFAVGY